MAVFDWSLSAAVSTTRGNGHFASARDCAKIQSMRNLTLIVAMLFVASACATHRGKAPNTPSAAAPAPSAAPATAATPSAPAAGTKTASSGVNQGLVKEGYRTTTKRGQIMYCRTEPITGTRFTNNVCLTETQIIEQRQNARDALTAPRQAECIPKGCGG
jgi:hypothetical protein